MNNVLKYGLIAVAVWWLLKDNIAFAAGGTEKKAPQPAQGTGSPANAQTPPAQNTPPANPPLQTQPAVTEAMIIKAAADPALAYTVPGVLLTSDQWNFYNALATGVQTTADLFDAGNRDEKITAVEYWRRRHAAGLGRLVWR
jgi:hypothetical protein